MLDFCKNLFLQKVQTVITVPRKKSFIGTVIFRWSLAFASERCSITLLLDT